MKLAKNIDRSTEGLRVVLFEALDELRSGKLTPQNASALARVSATIIASSKLDIEYQRFVKSSSADGDLTTPLTPSVPPLRLVRKK